MHEKIISHIRRLMEGEFAHRLIHETQEHFAERTIFVETTMNSAPFEAPDGRELDGLARHLQSPCEEVVRLEGERIPK